MSQNGDLMGLSGGILHFGDREVEQEVHMVNCLSNVKTTGV